MPTSTPSGPNSPARKPRLALVLSGGGARGAYEAGMLAWIMENIPERLGHPVHFDIITGTSVGAIHACYLAARQDDPSAAGNLLDIWRSLSLDQVFALRATDVFSIPRRLASRAPHSVHLPAKGSLPERLAGLFDTGWLEAIVLDHIAWADIRRNLDAHKLHGLAVAATEIGTGRSIVFIDNASGEVPTWSRDPFVVGRPARIGPAHALASAAIPLAFPAVRVEDTFYSDGGLRMNTPLSPALRLGADRVLVLGLGHILPEEAQDRMARGREDAYTSTAFLAGKALDALMLDRVHQDVDRLRLFNALLESGLEVYGSEFLDTINVPIIEQRGTPYRIVHDLFLQPSEDLGKIAGECLQQQPPATNLGEWLTGSMIRYLGGAALGEADLLSYLYFDRPYTERLIELGRNDAAAAEDRLLEFFSV